MSTQRRRVLEDSKLIIPADGVYIEGLDRKVYTVDTWQGGSAANSIIVASGDVKFRMALTEAPSEMELADSLYTPFETYMMGRANKEDSIWDYNGKGNTENILKLQSGTTYAAGYCNAFIFPDGKTRGYLPSMGQWNLVYQNKEAVVAALHACGGTPMDEGSNGYYWSSTYGFIDSYYSIRFFWALLWRISHVNSQSIRNDLYVRPFADIS